jgi:hypothetical protein
MEYSKWLDRAWLGGASGAHRELASGGGVQLGLGGAEVSRCTETDKSDVLLGTPRAGVPHLVVCVRGSGIPLAETHSFDSLSWPRHACNQYKFLPALRFRRAAVSFLSSPPSAENRRAHTGATKFSIEIYLYRHDPHGRGLASCMSC